MISPLTRLLRPALRAVSVFAAVLGCALPLLVHAASPTFVDIPPSGGSYVQPNQMNASGQIVGTSTLPGDVSSEVFFFDPATGSKQTVPTFGLGNVEPSGLSDNGSVLGRFIASYDANGYFLPHVFVWNATSGGQDIGSLGGTFTDTQGVSRPMNAAGQVTVRAQTAAGETHAAYWDATGGLIDLGTLGGNDSFPNMIGQNGHVIGSAKHADGSYGGFIWDKAHGMVEILVSGGFPNPQFVTADGVVWGTAGGGTVFRWDRVNGAQTFANPNTGPMPAFDNYTVKGVTPGGLAVVQNFSPFSISAFVFDPITGGQQLMLPGASGGYTEISAPNAAGQAVGSTSAADGYTHAFLWDAVNGMQDLGTLPGGSYSAANGINDQGQVVGSADDSTGAQHLFRWDAASGMQDLGTPFGTTSYFSVEGINNAGFEGVYQAADGTQHAYFVALTPRQVRDTQPPVITSVTATPSTLWPANHKMVAITVTAKATDNVGVTSLKITRVTSSEPDNGLGDGDTANDISLTGPLTVALRAERSGKGNGRTYTITVEAKDAAGNAATKSTTVFVPKNQSGK